ncbi:hypothetical protein GF340_01570 [Candidatus Peregrinibacteria bacterium]|nr:hypothetical protein [Candidatus Peregrinibacteria bacterium]
MSIPNRKSGLRAIEPSDYPHGPIKTEAIDPNKEKTIINEQKRLIDAELQKLESKYCFDGDVWTKIRASITGMGLVMPEDIDFINYVIAQLVYLRINGTTTATVIERMGKIDQAKAYYMDQLADEDRETLDTIRFDEDTFDGEKWLR